MSDVSPQKRASEVEEEAPEAKIAKLKADIKSSEDAQVSNGQEKETDKAEAKTEESGEKNGTTTVADAVDQVLNGDLQEEDDEDEEDEDYDDEEDDEDHGEQGEAEFENYEDSEGDDEEEDDEEDEDDEENYSNDDGAPDAQEESNGGAAAVDNGATAEPEGTAGGDDATEES